MDLKNRCLLVLLRICTSSHCRRNIKDWKGTKIHNTEGRLILLKEFEQKIFKITLRPTNTYLWIVKQTLQNEKSIFTSSRKLSRWFICSFIEERLRLTWSFKACSSVLKDSSCLALWKKNQFDYYLGYNFLKMKITLAFICQLKKIGSV